MLEQLGLTSLADASSCTCLHAAKKQTWTKQQSAGEHDNLMIQLKDKDLGFMLPFANALVPDVDFEGGRIMITPPAGILDCAIPLARASEAPE